MTNAAGTTTTPISQPKPARSNYTTIVWLFQLVFPTIGLAHVLIWLLDPFPIGRFGLSVLAFCLLWYGACFLGLVVPAGRRWIAKHSKLLIVLYLVLSASLVTAEMACRSLQPVAYDPRAPHITALSRELGWTLVPGAGDIGEHGFRRPCYPRDKGPGKFRIVCLGDSTTFGVGCSWKDAWPHQLEALLNQDKDWSKLHGATEVLNLGVVMYGPDQSLLVLKRSGLSYSPDLVIFHLCIDDFADVSFDYHWKMNFGNYMYRPFFVLDRGRLVVGRDYAPPPKDAAGNPVRAQEQVLPNAQLRLFSFLRTHVHEWFIAEPRKNIPEPTKAHWPIHEAFRAEYLKARPLAWALLKEMAKVSSEAGAAFLVTLSPYGMCAAENNPPWRVASFLREYEEDAQAAGITALNCVPRYFAEGGNDRFLLPHSPHYLNANGNALVARTTLRWLKEGYSK